MKTVEVKMESINKTQTEGNLEMKDKGTETGTSEASLNQQNARDERENLRH